MLYECGWSILGRVAEVGLEKEEAGSHILFGLIGCFKNLTVILNEIGSY
jgi:hypothetical protein